MNIKPHFKFEQTIVGLTAFVGDIEKKLHNIIEMPVFVLHSGDGSYWLNAQFHETDAKVIYECIPRFVIKLDTIEMSSSDLTNAYNEYNYINKHSCVGCPNNTDDEEKVYRAKVRRIPLKINTQCTMVSSSYIDSLINMEIMLSIFNRENAFTYDYDGNTYHAAYSIPSIDSQNITMPEMDISGQTRNVLQEFGVELQLHIYSPRVESINQIDKFKYVPEQHHNHQFLNQEEVDFNITENLHDGMSPQPRKHKLNFNIKDE